jgi:V/A-type H+-transporting ATPase subunit I
MPLLLLALSIGVLHITIALLTGFLEEARHHGTWKAFCAKASWLILLLGVGLLASASVLHTPTTLLGAFLAVLAVILIIIGEGARGLIELPAIFSNIASYARLMAVGVASAGLAIVTNELAGSLFASGSIVLMALGASVLVLGHLVNIALGLLGSFIHGLRLNYVEFFGKFYEGGGKPYKPFGGEHV